MASVVLLVKGLEVFCRHRSVKVLIGVADAKFRRCVAVGAGTGLPVEIVRVAGVAVFGVVDVRTRHLIHHAWVL